MALACLFCDEAWMLLWVPVKVLLRVLVWVQFGVLQVVVVRCLLVGLVWRSSHGAGQGGQGGQGAVWHAQGAVVVAGDCLNLAMQSGCWLGCCFGGCCRW